MRVILLAEEAAGVRVLRTLHQRSEELVGVVSTPSRQHEKRISVSQVAETLGYDVISPGKSETPELAKIIKDASVDILLNVHSLSILHSSVVSAPRIGSFNLHPGPLPEFAGLNAPSWAIYLGSEKHAVTLHWMQEGIDTGPIAFAEWFDLSTKDTALSVSAKCVALGVPLIEKLLDAAKMSPAAIPRVPQTSGNRKFFKKSEIPNGGWVDWSDTSESIAAFVRASDYGPFESPWGPPNFSLDGTVFAIISATVLPNGEGGVPGLVLDVKGDTALVASGDGRLVIRRLRVNDRAVDVAKILRRGQILAGAPEPEPEPSDSKSTLSSSLARMDNL